MNHIGGNAAQEDDAHRQHVQFESALTERREERRTDLQTNRIDKEDESEILCKRLHLRVEVHTEMGEGNRNEENPRNAQGNALELQLIT